MEGKNIEMVAQEAFIRRASAINLPFMLKGSYVTRQYFPQNIVRIPADLDWVYLIPLEDEKTARQALNEWATAVTELPLEDGVVFRSFKENEFWRMIDYAMADDFPTVDTDIKCWVDGKEIEFGLDVSFNLEVEQPPIPLKYQPLIGKRFTIPNTVPLSLQVSWKIHQTLVRPRFKDLFDLLYLVQHQSFDKQMLAQALQALINECLTDNVDLKKLEHFVMGDLYLLFPDDSMQKNWNYWRHNVEDYLYEGNILYFGTAERLTQQELLPKELSIFLEALYRALEQAGFNEAFKASLPKPKKRSIRNFFRFS